MNMCTFHNSNYMETACRLASVFLDGVDMFRLTRLGSKPAAITDPDFMGANALSLLSL